MSTTEPSRRTCCISPKGSQTAYLQLPPRESNGEAIRLKGVAYPVERSPLASPSTRPQPSYRAPGIRPRL